MGNGQGSVLPPDVRAAMEKQAGVRRGGGIGSAIPENADAARARAQAMDQKLDESEEEADAASEPKEDLNIKVCPNCTKTLQDEWTFCAKCGADLIRGGAAKKLGIEWTEDDLQNYVFKGFVVREIPFLKSTISIRSSIGADTGEIDLYLMEGSWRKDEKGKDRVISEMLVRQMQTLAITASCLHKFGGESIGNTLEERAKYLLERGAAMADMLNQRVVLFNTALNIYLRKADTFSGS